MKPIFDRREGALEYWVAGPFGVEYDGTTSYYSLDGHRTTAFSRPGAPCAAHLLGVRVIYRCHACQGRGVRANKPCRSCNGRGTRTYKRAPAWAEGAAVAIEETP